MSKLSDMVSKGVRLIVADPEADALERATEAARDVQAERGSPPPPPARRSAPAPPPPPAPRRERKIAAEELQEEPRAVAHSEVPADVADFGAVYQEAGIEIPLHGYGVDKVQEMLQSKRLAPLGREVKAAAIMAALEAAGVAVRDIVQDAVLRDKALDAFEAAKQKETAELRARAETRMQEIKEEMDTFLREKNAEIESLKQAGEQAGVALGRLQERKRKEEERLHEVVAHFIEGAENPITTQSNPRPGAPSDTK